MECHSRKNLHHCIFTQYPEALKSFRKNGKLTDITLYVEEKRYKVHSMILALASNFFQLMFTNHFQEDKEKSVTLRNINRTEFEIILDYIYGERLNITNENAVYLLIACDFLQISSASSICYRFILDNLNTVENIFHLYNFVCMDSDLILYTAVGNYVKKNCLKICRIEDFSCLSFDALKNFLSLHYYISNEDDEIFHLCEKWFLSDIELRYHHIVQLSQVLPRTRYNLVEALKKYEIAKPYIQQMTIPEYEIPRGALGPIQTTEDKPYISAIEEKHLMFYNFNGQDWEPLRGYGISREFSHNLSRVNCAIVYQNLFVIAKFKNFVPMQFYVTNMRTKRSTYLELPTIRQDHNPQNNLFCYNESLAFCHQWRVYTFSQEINRWVALSNFKPLSKFNPNYACDGEYIFAIGSKSVVNNYQTRKVYRFDQRLSEPWQRLPPLPSNIGELASCFLDNNIYVANYDSMYMLDCRNYQWNKLPKAPFNGCGKSMTIYQKKIYYLQDSNWISCFDVYTNTWSKRERPFLNCDLNVVHTM